MKVLILGAGGNLGTQLIKSAPSAYEIIALDYPAIDLGDFPVVTAAVETYKPEIIINAAAYNNVDVCEVDPKADATAQKINGEAVANLAKIALERNILLIHYSSDYVFSGEGVDGYKEDAEPAPINKYGLSKLAGEQGILKLVGQNLKYYLIRTAKLFGPAGTSNLVKIDFFAKIWQLAKEGKVIKAVNDEVGNFTYTPDLAKATWNLIETKKNFGIYHIVNERALSWYEAAKTAVGIAGINVEIVPVAGSEFARPALRPKNSTLLNTKLEALRDYETALKDYYEGYYSISR